MKQSHRNVYLVTAVVMLVVASIPFLAGARLADEKREGARSELATVLKLSHDAVTAWANQHLNAASLSGQSREIRALLPRLADATAVTDQHEAQEDAKRVLRPVLVAPDYQGFFLIDSDGVTVASSVPGAVGTSDVRDSRPDLFDRALAGATTLETPVEAAFPLPGESGEPATSVPTMLVAAPVADPGEQPEGVLVLAVDPRNTLTAILQRGRVGESGETYAFDADGLLMSESRFDDQLEAMGLLAPGQASAVDLRLFDPGVNLVENPDATIDTDLPLTRMATAAVAGVDGMDLDGYRDYRGVEVIGAWVWDDRLGFGIATEVDVAQVYGELAADTGLLIGATVGLELMLAIVGWLIARKRSHLIESSERLSQMNDALEARVEELTASREALRETERRLSSLVRSKDEFIASVSHELRTPLTSLLGFAEILKESLGSLPQSALAEMVDSLVQGGLELTLIVEDLLTAAKASKGELTVERGPVELNALAAGLVDLLGRDSPKEIVAASSLTWAFGDANRIRQITRNLISNALRYGGDHITVTTGVAGSSAFLAVADDGDGIADVDAERVFDPYQRAADAPGVVGSMGLGLTISRRLARLMDGDLTYRRVGGTTVFELLVPALTEGAEDSLLEVEAASGIR